MDDPAGGLHDEFATATLSDTTSDHGTFCEFWFNAKGVLIGLGHVNDGGCKSSTVILKLQEAVFLDLSIAVQVIVVTPK